MSLKAFKESLQTCSAQRISRRAASATPRHVEPEAEAKPEAEPVVARRPPKTSLREQFGGYGGSFVNLHLPSTYSAPPASQHPPKPCAEPKPCAASGVQDAEQRRVPERGSVSVGASDSRVKRSFSQGGGLQRCSSGVGVAKPEEDVADVADVEDEDGHVRKRRKKVESINLDVKPATEDDGAVHDSEAGLFIQSEKEGPYEPLVLWPPPGEGSSSGVEDGRVVQVPASINSRLLPHQRDGVKFLYNLYREDRGGILGDDMGLGKTIQTIALIAALLQNDGEVGAIRPVRRLPEGGAGKGTVPPQKVFLILCPTSVLQNWEQEFQAWGSFRVGIYHGANRDAILDKVQANELEVLLTSHDMFRLNLADLCKINWDCVIVDECHRLKNEKSQLYQACIQMKTKRRFGLTGTIMQNKYTEMFNVFDWAAPGSLGPREHFKEYYGEPLKQGQRISAPERFVRIAEERKKHLVKVLSRHLLRRTKQETIGHLMRGKVDNVVFCKMSDVQTRVYRRLLQSPDFQLLISKDLPCTCGSHLTRVECCHRTAPDGVIWSYLHQDNPDGCDWCPFCIVLPCLTKLQQVSNHLELIKPSPKDDPEKQKKDEQFASAALGEDAVLVGGVQQDESFMGISDAQHCGKMRALEKLLGTWLSKGDKVLLFSYSVKMLDILDRFLVRKAYSYCRLDGSTPMGMRQTLVDEFNNSPSKQVFLISTRAGGLGLNLVSANRVVIFDPNWNPAQDLQAQDRSFRYGQRRHVTVYRLLAAGSIEELVYSRQIYKQQLFSIGVNGTFEKRYFEGVQDSKIHKGELFGISNLFRDLSDSVFTSDIIENHDERVTGIHRPSSEYNPLSKSTQQELTNERAMSSKQIVRIEEAEGGDISGSENIHGSRGELEDDIEDSEFSAQSEEQSTSIDEIENNSQSQDEHLLEDAGVLYAHRNEEVVNVGGVTQKRKRSKTKELIYSVGDQKSVTSNSLVVNQHQPIQEEPTVKVSPDEAQEAVAGVIGLNSKQQEEPPNIGEMDATTKWFLSASGFFPAELIDSLSFT
ncbi:hypothetical protein M758_1G182900 [Ceratodon purpureus]|nr:hypothetical protein M758_1G182900 [Ceratodon purpureus]